MNDPTILTPSGPMSVPAFATVCPGLVIHRTLNNDDGAAGTWTITHVRSGLAVAFVDGSEWAQALAARLADVVDWTQPGADILASPARPRIRAIVDEFGSMHKPGAQDHPFRHEGLKR